MFECQDSQFPINFCESETCQCNVELGIQKETSIVAGGDHRDDPDEAVDGDRDPAAAADDDDDDDVDDDAAGNRNCGVMQYLKKRLLIIVFITRTINLFGIHISPLNCLSGKDDIGQGALLATLQLRNTGTETVMNCGDGELMEVVLRFWCA